MPITTIDSSVGLIVVDLQAGSGDAAAAGPYADAVANAATLTHAFRARRLPVVLVRAVGVPDGRTERPIDVSRFPDGWTDLVPELERHHSDSVVAKRAWDAFHDTGLADQLRDRGVTQTIVVGHATGFGVDSTARSAYAHGFHVTVPIDAVSDPNPAAHDHAVQTIFPMLGETGRTADVLAALPAPPAETL